MNGTNKRSNGSSDLRALYREQTRLNRMIGTYSRPALSAARRTTCAPIGFDQQAQVFQCPTNYCTNILLALYCLSALVPPGVPKSNMLFLQSRNSAFFQSYFIFIGGISHSYCHSPCLHARSYYNNSSLYVAATSSEHGSKRASLGDLFALERYDGWPTEGT